MKFKIAGSSKQISGVDVVKSTFGLACIVINTGAGSWFEGVTTPLLSVKLLIVIWLLPICSPEISIGIVADIGVICPTLPKLYV